MARTKEFDENEVLDRAIELFRRRGFKATSFGEMTAELEVSRQSLYDTFGDKETFFLAALQRYRERSIGCIRRALSTDEPIREQLRELFENTITFTCSKGSPGCLMINSMVEQALGRDQFEPLVRKHADEIEKLLADRIAEAQAAGEVPAGKDAWALARFLYHTLLGLGVAARAQCAPSELRSTARLALSNLD